MRTLLNRLSKALAALLALVAIPGMVAAGVNQTALDNGKALVSEATCEACHISKIGGDSAAIYSRKDRRVTFKSKLLPLVARGNSKLSLGLFPEDKAAIATYLNATHYKFMDE